jgi:hypothetical protein
VEGRYPERRQPQRPSRVGRIPPTVELYRRNLPGGTSGRKRRVEPVRPAGGLRRPPRSTGTVEAVEKTKGATRTIPGECTAIKCGEDPYRTGLSRVRYCRGHGLRIGGRYVLLLAYGTGAAETVIL